MSTGPPHSFISLTSSLLVSVPVEDGWKEGCGIHGGISPGCAFCWALEASCAPLRLGQCFPSLKLRVLRNFPPPLQLLGAIRVKFCEVMEGLGLWAAPLWCGLTPAVANRGDPWEKKAGFAQEVGKWKRFVMHQGKDGSGTTCWKEGRNENHLENEPEDEEVGK